MKEIVLFGKALKVMLNLRVDPKIVNELAITKGYIVHPDCCGQVVMAYLHTLPSNYNATFYKSFEDVKSKNRFELAMDQVMHYASTYGTDFTAKPYVHNYMLTAEYPKIDFRDAKLIEPMTIEELKEKIFKMLYAPIALKSETLIMLQDLLCEHDLLDSVDVDKIKNKECLMLMHKLKGSYPKSAVECVRYLVYIITGQTLLIKSQEAVDKIKFIMHSGGLSNPLHRTICLHIENIGIEKLAEVFYRFKPLFLAMKANEETSAVINKLRRKAKKFHKPMKQDLLTNLVSNDYDHFKTRELDIRLHQESNFTKVKLLNAINLALVNPSQKFYTIRNGKVFVKLFDDVMGVNAVNETRLKSLHNTVYRNLVESLSKKACRIRLPKDINLAMPSSEKMFVGDIPFNSYVDINKESVVGIHWYGADGAQDLDLSYMTKSGERYAWNSSYNDVDGRVVYSGDMTCADPEAAEAFYCANGLSDGTFKVNLYHGTDKCKFTLFVSKKTGDEAFHKTDQFENYCVDPASMVFNTPLTMDSKEMNVGFINRNRFYFNSTRAGNSAVSRVSELNEAFNLALASKVQATEYMHNILNDAGFELADDEDVVIDLSNPNKADIIALLSD